MQNEQSLATQFKNQGNDAFARKDYKEAIDFYSKAIEQDATQSIFFSNRAKAYKNLSNFEQAYKDALNAVELDDKNIKAHLISGQVLCEMGKLEEDNKKIELAITRLVKARTLCAGQKKQEFEKELDTYILRARKLLWMKQQYQEQQQNERYVKELTDVVRSDEKLSESEKEILQRQIQRYVKLKPVDYNIPDFLKCNYKKELAMDPHTTEAGYSYDHHHLLQFFRENGDKDPLTKSPINRQQVFPNVNLRQAVDDFLQKNPWAFQYKEGEKFNELQF